jgi:hypothetical protein
MPPTVSVPSQVRHPSLLQIIRGSKKPENFWLRIYYTAAAFLNWIALRVGWTPNQVTVTSALVNLAGFAYFMTVPTTPRAILWTYIIFSAAYLLDCADGQLAFVGNMRSESGYWLDSSLDIFKSAFVSLIVIKAIYTQGGGDTSTVVRVIPLIVFAAVGHFVNYTVGLHALRFRDFHDGYIEKSFERVLTSRGLKRYVTEATISHLREYANLLLAFALFAIDRQIALVCVFILGLSHWVFAFRRVVLIARRLE